jgi:hypothetical protein
LPAAAFVSVKRALFPEIGGACLRARAAGESSRACMWQVRPGWHHSMSARSRWKTGRRAQSSIKENPGSTESLPASASCTPPPSSGPNLGVAELEPPVVARAVCKPHWGKAAARPEDAGGLGNGPSLPTPSQAALERDCPGAWASPVSSVTNSSHQFDVLSGEKQQTTSRPLNMTHHHRRVHCRLGIDFRFWALWLIL